MVKLKGTISLIILSASAWYSFGYGRQCVRAHRTLRCCLPLPAGLAACPRTDTARCNTARQEKIQDYLGRLFYFNVRFSLGWFSFDTAPCSMPLVANLSHNLTNAIRCDKQLRTNGFEPSKIDQTG